MTLTSPIDPVRGIPATPARGVASAVLSGSALFWWFAAIAGQWAFLCYIAMLYGVSTLTGNFQVWTKNHLLAKGYVPGDTAGNLAFGAHALMAGVIAFGGTVQLIPWIRRRAIALHRWNGRLFIVTALGVSVTGLYMIWIRQASPSFVNSLGISLDAALIILFAGLAWRSVRARDIDSHRRWALRTFMVANGQWFFRAGVFAWIVINRGPAGMGKHFDGPFIVFWVFGCYLVPLAMLEMYLRAQQSRSDRFRLVTAGSLIALTIVMSVGIAAVAMFMWRPVLARL